jgi:hypothetical protein
MGRAKPNKGKNSQNAPMKTQLSKFYTNVLFIENLYAARSQGCTRSQPLCSSVGMYAFDRRRCAQSLLTASEIPRRKAGSDGG